MELRLALDPADLDRFRNNPILKTFKRGRPRNRAERAESPAPIRLNHSVYTLVGGAWSAEMRICHGEREGKPVCNVALTLLTGPPAPLCALLQALADSVPFAVDDGSSPVTSPVKAKPPLLQEGMEAGEAFSLIATSAIAHLGANQRYLLQTGEPEAVHQMRVAVRRLRSAMTMFKALLGDPASEALRPELRWLQQTLGAARDWDVLLADTVTPLRALFDEEEGFEKLCLAIEGKRQNVRDHALAELDGPRLTRLMLQLTFWSEGAGEGADLSRQPVGNLARAILEQRHKKVKKQIKHLAQLSAEDRHNCRIAVKKLRYAVDFFSGLFPGKSAQRLLPLLANLQDRLGTLNDLVTAKTKLEELVLAEGAADMAWTAGQVMGWQTSRSSGLLTKAQQDWEAIERLPAFWRG
jgi:CHAD domain-containing protein